jgi:anti-sigma-K factor RskA
MSSPQDDEEMDLLVGYALGTLDAEDLARASRLIEHRPELRQVLAELHAVADQLPAALEPVDPPPELRQRTLDYAVGRAPRPSKGEPGPLRLLRRWMLGLGSAAAAALIAAVVLWSQLTATRAELARVQAELAGLRATQQQIVAVIARPEALVALTGPGGSGTVVRNTDGSAVVFTRLPQLEASRIYQLWLIQGTNPPVSGGTFSVDPQGYGILTLNPQQQALAADTFAVTDEPSPGSPGPTTDILVAGKLPPA